MSPLPDLPDADAIAAAIVSCPSVSGLSGGVAGEIATYLPGRRVSGVRTQPDSVEVHVIARYGATMDEVASQVRGAVTAAVGEAVRIDVVIADVEDPFAPVEDDGPAEPPALEAGPSAALPAAVGSASSIGPAGAGSASVGSPSSIGSPSGTASPAGPPLPMPPAP